jgi:plastocyanin
MRYRETALLLIVIAATSCSSNSGSYTNSGSSLNPTPTTTATTISIVGQNGANSFSPNPATVTQGTAVVWQNNDTTTHHIVLNDGSIDTGLIAPGATSPAVTFTAASGGYHCTIHPTMVGSINTPTTTTMP